MDGSLMDLRYAPDGDAWSCIIEYLATPASV